ncbi:ScbR family autoregulator-binding transcription factor [Streptomyces sp. NPDC056672]|uniref:ScbR family autoregulator-binding transcription factor n=1 Tax=Streptomyces sp. NPDC056672 TaxID=3345906 RepID=UPI0036A9E832
MATQKRATQQRAVDTRRAILEAAGAVFAEHGYASATLSMVMEKAGVTKGALYHHFKSKEALAQAVLDVQPELGAIPPHPSKIQQIVDITFAFSERMLTDPLVRGSTRLSTDQDVGPQVDYSSPYRDWPNLLVQLLEEARDQGELLPTVNLRDAAEYLTGAYGGVQLMSLALTQRADLRSRLSVLWGYLLPNLALPGLILKINIAPDRGLRILGIPGSAGQDVIQDREEQGG